MTTGWQECLSIHVLILGNLLSYVIMISLIKTLVCFSIVYNLLTIWLHAQLCNTSN